MNTVVGGASGAVGAGIATHVGGFSGAVLAGAGAGAVDSTGTQLLTTGNVNLTHVATATGLGAAAGGLLHTAATSRAPSSRVAIGPAGNPGALTAPQRAQYLFDNWHPATFPNRTQSISYHLGKHGNGRTAFEYTRDAQHFFSQNRHLATDVTLRDGTAGLRIQTKVPTPSGGSQTVGGYWTRDGRLVTFWD